MNKQIVHEVFESMASRHSDKVAIEHNGQSIQYGILNANANKIAHALQGLGLTKESVVGTYFESSIEYVTSILGINKAGGVFMPLELDFPVKRLEHLLGEVAPAFIITHQQTLPALLSILEREVLGGLTVTILTINPLADDIAIRVYDRRGASLPDGLYASENLNVVLDGNNSNYLIYTSGSTGRPKVIEGCHKGLSHFIHWEIGEFNLDDTVRVSQLAPISFDVSFRDIFVPLLAGGTLCIPDKEVRTVPQKLVQWMNDQQLTMVHIVPTLFRLLTDELIESKATNALTTLRYVLLAGEPLFGKDVLRWQSARDKRTQLVNIYGPSETTLAKMFHRIGDELVDPYAIIPLGKAISNTAALILNEGKLCQIGEPGRLYIKTPFRSKGYYRNEALTKEKFVQNPLHTDFDDVIYDTGDMAKFADNMDVIFLGRQDNQIKIRGNRIELLEVEKVLVNFQGVKEVAVTIIEESDDDKVLACYYTGEADMDEAQVKKYLTEYLPSYMHPSYYVRLATFPKNKNGKLDRNELPKPTKVREQPTAGALTELERKLETIWKDVLKVADIGRDDSFFTIGGSSLKGIKIISKIYKECNVLLKLSDLFTHSTIRQLAELLSQSAKKSFAEITPIGASAYHDVSHAQRRLWILSHFGDENIAYNMMYAYTFEGNLQVASLHAALQTVIERHESLRTVMVSVNGEPKQKVLSFEELGFAMEEIDLRGEDDPDTITATLAENEWAIPFNLEQGPLLRAKLLQLPGEKFVFLFAIHHIVSDGWSTSIWIQEVMALYNAYSRNEPNPLKPLSIQYKDFAAWQNKLIASTELTKHQDYWLKQFTPLPTTLTLPADKVRPATKTFNGKHLGIKIDQSILKPLRELCSQNDATLFMGLLSSINILFYRLTGQSDITIGTPTAGRDHEGLENQIGLYVNTLALRSRFSPHDSFVQVLSAVKEVTSGAYAHQIYPFDYLVDQLDLVRDVSRSPLFDTMIVFHDTKTEAKQPQALSNVEIGNYYSKPRSTKFDLNLNFAENQTAGLNLIIEYNSDVFSAPFINALSLQYTTLLQSIVASGSTPVHALEYVPAAERHRLLHEFNETVATSSKPATLHELIEQQTERTPNAVALVCEGDSLTYKQLNARANALAHYLRQTWQVKPDDRVAIALDRSINLVVGILGILKAGAAYVPIDVAYPTQRIEQILTHSGVKGIILDTKFSGLVGDQFKKILISKAAEEISSFPATNPVRTTQASNLAYIIYTSGSTGAPKGVAVEHASVVNYVRWANQYYFNNESGHAFALHTSIAFDLTITSLFTTLLRGDSIVIYNYTHDQTSDMLYEIFQPSGQASVVKLTPSHVSVLGTLDIKETNITKVILGGEVLREEHVSTVWAINPLIRIYNEYGPTEATVGCVVQEIINLDDVYTIGVPVADSKIYIVDEFRNVQPIGVKGEICIGGIVLARGYHNDATLTASRFVDNPFAAAERMYHTADIGRWNVDGTLELFGRKDRQVKIRGHRIELDEIESHLLKIQGITGAFARVWQDETGDAQLLAYTTGQPIPSTEIKNALRKTIPDYMVPAYIVSLEKFPLTANAKVHAEKLPLPEKTNATVKYVAPSNNVERKLAAIWEDVLNVSPVSVEDSFFELGGHSLKAMRIISKIYKELNVRLSLRSLFTNQPTIRSLAREIVSNDLLSPELYAEESLVGEREEIII
ncbi:non-ribosomal peptide synthetase [Chryseolinea lacunae]|uniref:Amino acid adenylation domain-containing protein n=1 Tax=Chryseolinea lacunae TaxID=2801331 RepID=A0ABS1KUA9_9BACT|nr:non-ribosomal peptide synthetase [Chryseolinea lacunae]MBL0743065.1 amino acid adenylation domain-containing protein [Chryseolinea lacunae]